MTQGLWTIIKRSACLIPPILTNMTVTEFATLQLNTSITSEGPLPSLFTRLQSSQSSWSHYPVLLYSDVSAQPTAPAIHLISGWESVEAHQKWIESAENQELLRLLGPYMNITGFSHLTLNFEEFQRGRECADDPEGLLVVNKDGQLNERLGEPLWTGQGNDLEDDSRPLFRLAFYKGEKELEFEGNGRNFGMKFIEKFQ
ncbi:hypothetical protein V5O48_004850 [Marasmius crinis-equi]|uniref:DUF3291 domain-containing protein n=1 Tax=Marasmius crinis-equi TaxID=585013 RepID=A0ABR3FPF4_9AGAR